MKEARNRFSGNNIDELFATMEETLDRLDTITEED